MRISLFIFILAVISCQTDISPKVLHKTYDFSIKLPEGWKHEQLQGIDSRVGLFTNHRDSLYYDFGMYTNGFDAEFGNKEEYTISSIRIDKRNGQLLVPAKNKAGITGVFLQVDKYNTLTITGRVDNPKSFRNVFDTIRFL